MYLTALVVWIALLYSSALGATIPELIGTKNYISISQYKCLTIVEHGHDISDNVCPRSFAERSSDSNFNCKLGVRMHLMRDPRGLRPPKLMLIGQDPLGGHNLPAVAVIDIPLPNLQGSNQTDNLIVEPFDFARPAGRARVKFLDMYVFGIQKLMHTIYDWKQQLLYVIRKEHATLHLHLFYVENLDFGSLDDMTITKLFEKKLHAVNHGRFHWTEDPYTEMAYYTYTDQMGESPPAVFEVPMHMLLPALLNGYEGRRVFQFDSRRDHVSATGGVVVSKLYAGQLINTYMRQVKAKDGVSLAMKCTNSRIGNDVPTVYPYTIVKDFDYELLRDPGASRNEYLAKKEDCFGDVWHIWFTIVVVLLSFVILILLCCLCMMRRNVDEIIEKPSTAAMHRSVLAASYHRPSNADLDATVDTWKEDSHIHQSRYQH